MSDPRLSPRSYEPGEEPERYELDEAASRALPLNRRDFLKHLGAGVLLLLLLDSADAQESGGGRRSRGGGSTPQEIGAWLHVGEDGTVTVFTGKTEVGQNARTSLSQAVAEELHAPMSSIRLVMADTDHTPYDAGTFGSRTTPAMAPQLRRAAAAARELLIELAAEQWKTDRATLRAENGAVIDRADSRTLSYGQLTRGQKLARTVPGDTLLEPAAAWKVAGTSVPKVDGRDYVTGKHRYTSDVKLPEMRFGSVLRAPAPGVKAKSLDTKPAEALPGVSVVRDGDFIGVTAPSSYLAAQAVSAIQAEWEPVTGVSDPQLYEHLKRTGSTSGGGRGGGRAGSIPEGLAAAEVRLQASYPVAYIAHAPLEPRAAAAQWEGEKLTVWTGTQRPFGVRSELAAAFGIPETQVRVIVPDTGSGYGGKHTGEAAVEAARLAKAAGKPVKLVWTREEEFTWAYFRPAGLIEVASGARRDGTLTAWEFHNYNSGGSAIETPYEVPHRLVQFHSSQSPLRQGSYRGLAATANHFARETHMDELAQAVRMDPLEFRLKNLKDQRLRAVLQAAADRFGWGQKLEAHHGAGIAVGTEKGSFVATCVEAAVDPMGLRSRPRVIRAVMAFECGAVVNPDHLKNQVEGSFMMGLGGALFEAMELQNGRVMNPRFSRYRVPRFSDLPQLEVVLLDRKDLPSAGAGETPIVTVAPAIGNALFAASGLRLRSLPMAPRGTIGSF